MLKYKERECQVIRGTSVRGWLIRSVQPASDGVRYVVGVSGEWTHHQQDNWLLFNSNEEAMEFIEDCMPAPPKRKRMHARMY